MKAGTYQVKVKVKGNMIPLYQYQSLTNTVVRVSC